MRIFGVTELRDRSFCLPVETSHSLVDLLSLVLEFSTQNNGDDKEYIYAMMR